MRDIVILFDHLIVTVRGLVQRRGGSLLPKNYLFWKAIDQGKYGFHHYQPGDIYAGNTAFGSINTP
jgi:hypothetical protein